MKIFFTFTAFLLFALQVNSQPNVEWVRRYDSQLSDWAYAIDIDNDRNIYVTGLVGFNSQDIGTIKYDEQGNLKWFNHYNGTDNVQDWGYDIAVDSQKNVYVTGYCWDNYIKNMVAIKYDSNGTEKWVRKHDGISQLIKVDNNNDIIMAGYNDSLIIIKFNGIGNTLWYFAFKPPNTFDCYPYKIIVDENDNIYIGGGCETYSTEKDFMVLKLNSNGVLLWHKEINGYANLDDHLKDIELSKSRNLYVTGITTIVQFSISHILTLSYDSSGILNWQKIDSTTHLSPYQMISDINNNIYLIGFYFNSVYSNEVVKYNMNGNLIWVKQIMEPSSYHLLSTAIVKDSNDNIYVTGYRSVNAVYTTGDYFTFKFDTNGNILWSTLYNGPANNSDMSYDIKLDNKLNIYVTGTSVGSYGFDYCTIKYSQPIGIKPISTEIPDKFSLSQNYPNPFNPTTKIKFNVPVVSLNKGLQPLVQLKVYDILGREIQTLVNETLKAGTYEVEFDGSNLGSGVYYYKLTAGDYSGTKKMVLIK